MTIKQRKMDNLNLPNSTNLTCLFILQRITTISKPKDNLKISLMKIRFNGKIQPIRNPQCVSLEEEENRNQSIQATQKFFPWKISKMCQMLAVKPVRIEDLTKDINKTISIEKH